MVYNLEIKGLGNLVKVYVLLESVFVLVNVGFEYDFLIEILVWFLFVMFVIVICVLLLVVVLV